MKTSHIIKCASIFAIIFALVGFFVPRLFGADSITEDFQNTTISPQLQNSADQ